MTVNTSKTPMASRDEWRTPPYIFAWLDRRYSFDIDLAATHQNKLCKEAFCFPNDALEVDWHSHGSTGFCNPPYSNIAPWLAKGRAESLCGFTSVFLIPTPNGERLYDEYVFDAASEVIFITGRLSFLTPDGIVINGNRWGSMIVVYRAHDMFDTRYRHVRRADIKAMETIK